MNRQHGSSAGALVSGILLLVIHSAPSADTQRSYNQQVVTDGQHLFQQFCSACHGTEAQSTVTDWHLRDENGQMPPPPLNGTAHTWHHSLRGLMHTVRNGTQSIGGNMPAFRDQLSDDEIFSIILWLTSLWPDEIFETWMRLNQQ